MDQNDNFDQNDDFPPDFPQQDPPPFPEPILDCCVIITANVRFRDGNIQFCANRVIVKNGLSAPFNRAGGLLDDDENENENDNDNDSTNSDSDGSQSDEEDPGKKPQKKHEIAYLIKEDICEAIYGRVFRGTVLRRSNETDVWTETTEECAIKEMAWDSIRNGRGELCSENPQDEIATMQHLMRFYADDVGGEQVTATTAMHYTRIIMPLDFLYDHQNLYTITPYCSGGELLDELHMNMRFTEDRSREILRSVLDGVEWLQRAGLTHKDISLENIMVNGGMTVIIDMGMCLRIPFSDDGQRRLIRKGHRCGKMIYIAPEVFDLQPFDGYAVDMWAVGVCLFVMLTGQKPWERPSLLDAKFRNFTGGYLTPILTSYNILSGDAIDILQRMLFLDPRDRMSLQQVRNHPWMTGLRST